MSRKPISIEVVEEGGDRHVLLTYANGDVVKRRVETHGKARRRPRRPQTRVKLADTNKREP